MNVLKLLDSNWSNKKGVNLRAKREEGILKKNALFCLNKALSKALFPPWSGAGELGGLWAVHYQIPTPARSKVKELGTSTKTLARDAWQIGDPGPSIARECKGQLPWYKMQNIRHDWQITAVEHF